MLTAVFSNVSRVSSPIASGIGLSYIVSLMRGVVRNGDGVASVAIALVTDVAVHTQFVGEFDFHLSACGKLGTVNLLNHSQDRLATAEA